MEIKKIYLHIVFQTQKTQAMETILNSKGSLRELKVLVLSIAALFMCQIMFSEDNMDIETKPVCQENTYYYLSMADTFMAYNNYDDCLWALNKAIKCNPSEAGIYYRRGTMHLQLTHFSRAISDLKTAISLGLNTSDVYNNLGIAFYYNDKIDESMKSYNTALELNPVNANAYYNRGILRYSNEDDVNAFIDFQKAMEIDSKLNIDKVKSSNMIACVLK